MLADPLNALYAVLPFESHHVTVFNGTDERERASRRWPANLPRMLSIAEVSRRYAAKLSSHPVVLDAPVNFTVTGVSDLTQAGDLAVLLEPCPPSQERLRRFRAALSDLLEIDSEVDAAVDNYQYHVTIAYRIYESTRTEEQRLAKLGETLTALTPSIITIAGCQFTEYADMTSFPVLIQL